LPARRALELQAEVMRALSQSVRLQILLSLRDGERCVCEFEPILGLRQPNISQHLAILRGADLVTTRREGLRILYRLSDPDVLRVIDLVTMMVQRQGAVLAEAVREVAGMALESA
jgi:DNA-binding transcriptional ArsR family regulator